MKLFDRHCHTAATTIMSTFITLLLLTALAAPAAANPVTWNLSGVTFDDGGTVTGHFVFDNTLVQSTRIQSWDIIATIGPNHPQQQVPPGIQLQFEFTPANSRAYFQENYPWLYSNWDDLRFVNASPPWPNPDYDLSLYLPQGQIELAGPGQTIPLWNAYDDRTDFPPWYAAYGVETGVQPNLQFYTTGDRTGGAIVSVVPEPSTLLLLGPGLAGLWVWGRKKFKCI